MTKPYHVLIAPTAKQQILALPSKQQKQIIRFVEALCINPRPPGVKKLDGLTGLCRENVNHCKILYKIEEQEVLILVVDPV